MDGASKADNGGEKEMKKKLNKIDFLAINRIMNGNWNGKHDVFGATKKVSDGEILKLNREEQKKKGVRK